MKQQDVLRHFRFLQEDHETLYQRPGITDAERAEIVAHMRAALSRLNALYKKQEWPVVAE